MTCLRLLLLASCFSLALGGCASEPPKPTDPPTVKTLPWNTPMPGEGQGMGGMLNTR